MGNQRKYSRKREAILELMRSTDIHPSAEWIYQRLKPRFPDLSLGTVYRNIALFKDSGEIVSLGAVKGQERFDADVSAHGHFRCARCGIITDLDTPADGQRNVGLPDGLKDAVIESYELTLVGLCPDCVASMASSGSK